MDPDFDVPTSDPFLEALFSGETGYFMVGAMVVLLTLLVVRYYRRTRPADMD